MTDLAKLIQSMRLVEADTESDAMALDGKPFTPLYVGENFGNLYAQVQACARAIIALAEEGQS